MHNLYGRYKLFFYRINVSSGTPNMTVFHSSCEADVFCPSSPKTVAVVLREVVSTWLLYLLWSMMDNNSAWSRLSVNGAKFATGCSLVYI